MRSAWPLLVLALASCSNADKPTDGPGWPTVPSPVLASALPDALLARLGALEPAAIGGARPECSQLTPRLHGRLSVAVPARPRTAGGATTLAASLDAVAQELEAPALADRDLGAAAGELAAALRDLASALRVFAEAIAQGDEPAVRALTARFDNGIGNAEASVGKLARLCADAR